MTEFEQFVLKQFEQLNIKIDNLAHNQDLNTFKPNKDYLFFDWLNVWFNEYKVPKLKQSSLYQIQNCIKIHIKPNIENKLLTELSSLDIQVALNKIKTTRMRKYTYDIYNASLRQAYILKLIKENLMLGVEAVKHKRKIGSALTTEQQQYFLKCIKNNKMEHLYKFYLLTGCRKSEALSLKWCDIDFNNNKIFIDGTKTEYSSRYIPLFPALNNLLSQIKKHNEYVFPYSPNAVKCNFDRLKTKYNLTFTIHSLRHTFTTRCIENGIQLKTIQKWLGHSKLDTTANIYAHIQTEFETIEISKFNMML